MAYQQGLLTGRKITRLQKWALSYHNYMVEEKKYSERDEFIKIITRIVNPELFQETFANEVSTEEDDLGDGSGDYVVSTEDLNEDEELQAYLAEMFRNQTGKPELEEGEWV